MKYVDYTQNNLDISQLKEYFTQKCEIKNYKEMCSLLKENVTDGNSKKAQINRWKRYFDFYKEGQKYIITEIYAVPYPTDDARKRKEGLYIKYIELLLLEFLANQEGHTVTISNKDMYRVLGMVNDNYKENLIVSNKAQRNEKINEVILNNPDYELPITRAEGYTITNTDINNFYLRAEEKLNKILYTALRSMKNRFLIDYERVHFIIRSDNTGTVKTKIADDAEVALILKAKNAVMKEMGFNSLTEITFNFQTERFYKNVDKYVKEHYNWEGCYSRLKVIYIDDIAKQIPLKAEEIRTLTKEDKQSQLNSEIIKSLNTQAEYKYEENIIQVNDYKIHLNKTAGERSFGQKEKKPYEFKTNYVEIQKALGEYLLSICFRK